MIVAEVIRKVHKLEDDNAHYESLLVSIKENDWNHKNWIQQKIQTNNKLIQQYLNLKVIPSDIEN